VIVAVYQCEWTQYRLEERMTSDTLQSLEPIAMKFDESAYPFRHEWLPHREPILVYAPPGCTWVRSRGRIYLWHQTAKALDGYAVLCFARGGCYGFKRAPEGSLITPILKVVEREVPRAEGRMFEGLVGSGGPCCEPPPPRPPEPEPVGLATTAESAPAGFLF